MFVPLHRHRTPPSDLVGDWNLSAKPVRGYDENATSKSNISWNKHGYSGQSVSLFTPIAKHIDQSRRRKACEYMHKMLRITHTLQWLLSKSMSTGPHLNLGRRQQMVQLGLITNPVSNIRGEICSHQLQ